MSLIDKETKDDITRFFDERISNGGTARLLTFSTRDASKCQHCGEVRQLAEELAGVSGGRITAEHHIIEEAGELVERLKVKRVPATVVTDSRGELSMKFYGIPSGHEFGALLEDLADAAGGDVPKLSAETVQALQRLARPIHLQVFVTPSCPYCPRAVRMAHQFSKVNPKMIDAEMIESMEFPELAEKYSVMAVPKVVINEEVDFEGALPEKVFLFKIKEAVKERPPHEFQREASTPQTRIGDLKALGGKAMDLSDSDFDGEVGRYPLMLVDFWAPWCMPCRMVSPAVDQLAQQYAGKVGFGRVNVDENPVVANQFGIQSIPTLMLFRYGKAVDHLIGAYPKNTIDALIRTHLAKGLGPEAEVRR